MGTGNRVKIICCDWEQGEKYLWGLGTGWKLFVVTGNRVETICVCGDWEQGENLKVFQISTGNVCNVLKQTIVAYLHSCTMHTYYRSRNKPSFKEVYISTQRFFSI